MLLSVWRFPARRWYVVLIGVGLSAGLAFMIMSAVSVQYRVQSKILMLRPPAKVSGAVTNPYLNPGLGGFSDVLASAMSDATMQQKMTDAGYNATYAFTRDETAGGSVLLLKVTDDSAAGALASQNFLLRQLQPVLAGLQRQAGVPPRWYVTQMVIAQDDKPTRL